MHENNLINRISLIFENLRCKEIIDFLNQWNIDKVKLLSLVIESKLGYDRTVLDEDCKKFIDDIEESSIYSVAEYSQLIMFISTMGDMNSRFNTDSSILNKFQAFHKMLFKTGSLVLKLLHDNYEMMNPAKPQPEAGLVGNPLRNNISPPLPGTQNAKPSKVVSFDFSKVAPQSTNVPAPAPLAAPTASSASSNVASSTQNPAEQVKQETMNYQPARYIPSETQDMPVKQEEEVLSDDDMSLTNFLQSLAMLNVPAE